MAERQMIKNDLSWSEKLKYIWYVLRYSKRMAKWAVVTCEHCGHNELVRTDKPIENDNGTQKEFQQKYRCLHCNAIGIVTQVWVKEHGEYEN